MSGPDQSLAVHDMKTGDAFERQHAVAGPVPVDRGNIVIGFGRHVLLELGSGRRLVAQIELHLHP